MPSTRVRKSPPSASRPQVYTFTLTLAGADEVTPEIAEAVYATGANDATLASSGGILEAEFDREAPRLITAIVSAIRDVEASGLSVADVRVEEPLPIATIARRAGLESRALRPRPGFPAPAVPRHGSQPALYNIRDVASWLARYDAKAATRLRQELAYLMLVNAALELRRYSPETGQGDFVLPAGPGRPELRIELRSGPKVSKPGRSTTTRGR